MDNESGEPMEPTDEVPLKELGETESGASRGIPDDADCVFRILVGKLRMLLVNRVLKTNNFRECALKTALTRSTVQPKCTNSISAAAPPWTPLRELTALPQTP